MSKHSDIDSFLAFINVLFGECDGPINLCTLRNNAGGAGSQITSSDPEALKKFIVKGDQRGWGTYVCVSTMLSVNHHHSKEAIYEIPALHIDIDLKDLALDNKEDVVKKLKALRLPPSILVDSGNGIHAYWKFKESLTINLGLRYEDGVLDRVEEALKLLCDLVGGDQKVTQPSAVMRLPGTFNTKNENQNHLVTAWFNDANGKAEMPVYELDDIEEWLSETSPIILRKDRPQSKTVKQSDENPYERIAREMGYKPPLDVEQRLDAMMYMGGGDSSIHQTQIQVSASLLEAGEDVENIVALLMDATFAAAGDYGKRWNRKREERNIRKACEGWTKKRAKDQPKSKPREQQQRRTGTDDDENVIDFGAKKKEREDKTADAAEKKRKKNKKDKNPFHIIVGKTFLARLDELGQALKIFVDEKGTESTWFYNGKGIWSLIMDIKPWLEGHIELIIRGLNMEYFSEIKIRAEARAYILCSPNVRSLEYIVWDNHGKIPVKGNLIDPLTLSVKPIERDDFCTWTLDINYDSKAQCPWWIRMLDDVFIDRSTEDKQDHINLLQDFCGASLIDRKPKALRQALILVGESNSGKSGLIEVMSGLITSEPITTPIANLSASHGLQSFTKRTPWVLHEAFDQSTWHISSSAKLVLSGEPLEINPKGKNAITVRYTAPVYWATNHPPKFKEATKAMINRMRIMRLTVEFDKDEKIGAKVEAQRLGFKEPQNFVLDKEKSGLLNWALIGAQRAIKRGFYIDTKEGEEELEEVRLDSNISAGFIEDCVDFESDKMISTPDFVAAFVSWWRERSGEDRTPPSPDFIGRSLKALSHPLIAIDRKKFKDKSGLRFYVGVVLNQAGRDHWENATAGSANARPNDSVRTSSSIASVTRDTKNLWDDHPQIIRIKSNSSKKKTAPKF